MNKHDFFFELPEELIAQYPLAQRSDSRLLHFNRTTQALGHQHFKLLPELLQKGDLLVFNDTKVFPARFFGKKSSGGQVQFLIEKILTDNQFLAHIKASKAPKNNSFIFLQEPWQIEVLQKSDDLYHCQANGDLDRLLAEVGHIPLPLYINREDGQTDRDRYQTIYARHQGSVAAPTAGLHFDEPIFHALEEKGIEWDFLTLHVGAGTFRPVRTEKIEDHKMHKESYHLSAALCARIKETKDKGGRVIAVGTTSLRTLESAAQKDFAPGYGETDIFIYPGFEFKVCDGLITNFHLPESTLLMLVAAFIGYDQTIAMYQQAIANGYRFYSYGDACLLL